MIDSRSQHGERSVGVCGRMQALGFWVAKSGRMSRWDAVSRPVTSGSPPVEMKDVRAPS